MDRVVIGEVRPCATGSIRRLVLITLHRQRDPSSQRAQLQERRNTSPGRLRVTVASTGGCCSNCYSSRSAWASMYASAFSRRMAMTARQVSHGSVIVRIGSLSLVFLYSTVTGGNSHVHD